MALTDLGIRPIHSNALILLERPGLEAARIVRQDRERFRIQTASNSISGEVSGRYRNNATRSSDFPVVGDWVAVVARPSAGTATIHNLLPRFSSFSRKVAGDNTEEQLVAANVDSVFLVSGLDHDFNVRRIERYVTLAWNSGALPVIVLNKTDVAGDLDEKIISVEEVASGVDIVGVSAVTGEGFSELRKYLKPGETVALLGSSGVGKSTIVNSLLGEDRLRTAEVRGDDSRGRHTTTSRELFLIPDGGILIDTPRMRELQLWADEESLQGSFSEIGELASNCRFSDCRHESEPGCAIREALERGELSIDRHQSFLKLQKEIAYLDRRKSDSNYEERRHDRALGRMYKDVQRHNRKNK